MRRMPLLVGGGGVVSDHPGLIQKASLRAIMAASSNHSLRLMRLIQY